MAKDQKYKHIVIEPIDDEAASEAATEEGDRVIYVGAAPKGKDKDGDGGKASSSSAEHTSHVVKTVPLEMSAEATVSSEEAPPIEEVIPGSQPESVEPVVSDVPQDSYASINSLEDLEEPAPMRQRIIIVVAIIAFLVVLTWCLLPFFLI